MKLITSRPANECRGLIDARLVPFWSGIEARSNGFIGYRIGGSRVIRSPDGFTNGFILSALLVIHPAPRGTTISLILIPTKALVLVGIPGTVLACFVLVKMIQASGAGGLFATLILMGMAAVVTSISLLFPTARQVQVYVDFLRSTLGGDLREADP